MEEADETIVVGYTNKNKERSLQTKEAVFITAEKLPDAEPAPCLAICFKPMPCYEWKKTF